MIAGCYIISQAWLWSQDLWSCPEYIGSMVLKLLFRSDQQQWTFSLLNFLTISDMRVDTDVSLYEYSLKKIWCEWTWTKRFSERDELQVYFKFVNKKLDLSKNCQFNTCVTAAEFDMNKDQWNITTEDDQTTCAKYFCLCTGFAVKHYVPSFKNLKTFKRKCYHIAVWPQKSIELCDKKIDVISTEASDVQLIQEVEPIVKHLVSFLRQWEALSLTESLTSDRISTYLKHGSADGTKETEPSKATQQERSVSCNLQALLNNFWRLWLRLNSLWS